VVLPPIVNSPAEYAPPQPVANIEQVSGHLVASVFVKNDIPVATDWSEAEFTYAIV